MEEVSSPESYRFKLIAHELQTHYKGVAETEIILYSTEIQAELVASPDLNSSAE